MSYKIFLPLIGPLALSSNGTAGGIVTISDTTGFRVTQGVKIEGNALTPLEGIIQEILSLNQLLIIDPTTKQKLDLSSFTTAANSTITAPKQQKFNLNIDSIAQNEHELSPINAKRAVLVDKDGKLHNSTNPLITSAPFLISRIDYFSATITYVGKAIPGSLSSSAVWQIQKIDETTGLIITLADGNSNFDNVWDNRIALSYT